MMPQIVGRTPLYACGTCTMVLIAFRFDCDAGGANCGEVQVAICARRRTVSSGNLMDKSSAEPRKVKIDQVVGFIAGSMARYCFRKSGVDVAMNDGIAEVRNVMGIRCVGVR